MSVITETPCASIIEQISQEPQRQFWVIVDAYGAYLDTDTGDVCAYLSESDCVSSLDVRWKMGNVTKDDLPSWREVWGEERLKDHARAFSTGVVIHDAMGEIVWRLL